MPPPALNDVFQEYENFTLFQRIIGVSSLIHSNGKLHISRKWLIVSLIYLSANLFISFYTLQLIIFESYLSSWYSHLKGLYYVASVLCIFASWVRGNVFVDTLNESLSRMRVVDSLMVYLGEEVPLSKASMATLLLYTFLTLGYFLIASSTPNFFRWIQLLIFYSPYVLIISIEDIVDRINCLLRLRFDVIKKRLLRCFKMEEKRAVEVLEKLILCHDHLCNCSENVDEFLWIQVTSVLAVFFLASFCEVYAFSILYNDETAPNKEIVLAEKATWFLIIIIISSRMCHQFAAISAEVKSFTEYVLIIYRR